MNARTRRPLTPSRFLRALALAWAGAFACANAAYPEKAIRIVVPFPAGGASDATARAIGQNFAKLCPIARAVASDAPPAGNGTTMRIGFSG